MSSVRHALILAALLAAPACSKNTDGKKQMPPARGEGAPPLPALPTAEPASRPAVQPTEGKTTGTLYAHAEAQLAPAASGVISRVHVAEGDRVKRGQVVFQLDARDALLRKQQAEAALEAAQVNLRATQVEYDRTKSLFEQNAVVRAQWDQVQARLEAAQVGVRQGEAALAMAQKGVADATVRSPLDGVVTAKLKSEGEMATMMPPTIIAIIQDQDTLDLRFRLPEKALATVKAGSTVKARFEALGVTHEAKVTRIQPTIDPRTRTIEVVAELPNPDLALKPGLLAEVELAP